MSGHRFPKPSERGIALLSVLLLVAVMAIVTTLILDRVNLAVRLAANADAADRARFAALGAEQFAAREIKRQLDLSPARTVNVGGWIGQPNVLPIDDGSGAVVTATVRDGGNCFNLNSVVAGQPGDLAARLPARVSDHPPCRPRGPPGRAGGRSPTRLQHPYHYHSLSTHYV